MVSIGYSFLSAYLKGEESKVMTSEHVERMSRSSKMQDAITSIRDTDIGSYLDEMPLNTVQAFDDIEQFIWGYFGRCLDNLKGYKVVPSSVLKIVDSYVQKYDVSNIKAVVRSILTRKKSRLLPLGHIHSKGLLENMANAESIDEVAAVLRNCELKDYAEILLEGRDHIGESSKSRLQLEAKLDGQYYKDMLRIANRMQDGKLYSKVYSIVVDLINLQMVYRSVLQDRGSEAAAFFINGGAEFSTAVLTELLALKMSEIAERIGHTRYRVIAEEIASSYESTRSITVVDEVIEKHKYNFIREIVSLKIMSPVLVTWYLVLKEIEIRNMRLMLKAMSDDISLEKIRDYLVLPS